MAGREGLGRWPGGARVVEGDTVLRAVAHDPAYLILRREDRHAVEHRVARRGRRRAGEHAECRRLARTVDAKEAEALAGLNAQAEVTHRHLAARAAVHLAQVLEYQLTLGVATVDGGALVSYGVILKAIARRAAHRGGWRRVIVRLAIDGVGGDDGGGAALDPRAEAAEGAAEPRLVGYDRCLRGGRLQRERYMAVNDRYMTIT